MGRARRREAARGPERYGFHVRKGTINDIRRFACDAEVTKSEFVFNAMSFGVTLRAAEALGMDTFAYRHDELLGTERRSFDDLIEDYSISYAKDEVGTCEFTLSTEKHLLGMYAAEAFYHPSTRARIGDQSQRIPQADVPASKATEKGANDERAEEKSATDERVESIELVTEEENNHAMGQVFKRGVLDYLARIRAEQDGWQIMIVDPKSGAQDRLPRVIGKY